MLDKRSSLWKNASDNNLWVPISGYGSYLWCTTGLCDVLGTILFSCFCNDLPNITKGIDGDLQLQMHADNTTIYVLAPTYDLVASRPNEV